MTGAGNDFILADNRTGNISLSPEQVAHLCDRRFGIGADGVILLVTCSSGKADWAWQFWNSDGSDAEMCGNGARCFARFIQRLVNWEKPSLTFETVAGVITAEFAGKRVTVSLTRPQDLRLHQTVDLASGPLEVHSVNTGVPHAVVFVPDADQAMVQETGRELRLHPHFGPKGANVNFVQITDRNHIRVRTYERGIEGETLACGTGVSASALVSAQLHDFSSPVCVRVQSGEELRVSFTLRGSEFSDVRLNGPATFVFDGRIELE